MFEKTWELGYIEVEERSSSSIFRKWFLSPRRGSNPQPSDDRLEGCGFDPRLELRNHCLSIKLEDHSSTPKLNLVVTDGFVLFCQDFMAFRHLITLKTGCIRAKNFTIKGFLPNFASWGQHCLFISNLLGLVGREMMTSCKYNANIKPKAICWSCWKSHSLHHRIHIRTWV